jgi:TetR/AcrR family transcriptional repressor of nem operon
MTEHVEHPTHAAPATRKGEETRERILTVARDLIHQHGFKQTGLADILAASRVPKGSFYFYFRSKEELATELLRRHRAGYREAMERDVFPPGGETIPQLVAFFRGSAQRQAADGCKSGCLLGNLAAEIGDIHEDLRREVVASFMEMRQALTCVLARGQARGELKTDFAPEQAAEFLMSVMEGSVLLAKARREPAAFAAIESSVARYLETLRNPARPPSAATMSGGIS